MAGRPAKKPMPREYKTMERKEKSAFLQQKPLPYPVWYIPNRNSNYVLQGELDSIEINSAITVSNGVYNICDVLHIFLSEIEAREYLDKYLFKKECTIVKPIQKARQENRAKLIALKKEGKSSMILDQPLLNPTTK